MCFPLTSIIFLVIHLSILHKPFPLFSLMYPFMPRFFRSLLVLTLVFSTIFSSTFLHSSYFTRSLSHPLFPPIMYLPSCQPSLALFLLCSLLIFPLHHALTASTDFCFLPLRQLLSPLLYCPLVFPSSLPVSSRIRVCFSSPILYHSLILLSLPLFPTLSSLLSTHHLSSHHPSFLYPFSNPSLSIPLSYLLPASLLSFFPALLPFSFPLCELHAC